MSKPIVLSTGKWIRLKSKLLEDYPRSVVLIRQRSKEVLGFVPREFEEWNTDSGDWQQKRDVRLDFYNDSKRTMFLLKYSEYLDKSSNINLDIE
jgi:hypothetical protein